MQEHDSVVSCFFIHWFPATFGLGQKYAFMERLDSGGIRNRLLGSRKNLLSIISLRLVVMLNFAKCNSL